MAPALQRKHTLSGSSDWSSFSAGEDVELVVSELSLSPCFSSSSRMGKSSVGAAKGGSPGSTAEKSLKSLWDSECWRTAARVASRGGHQTANAFQSGLLRRLFSVGPGCMSLRGLRSCHFIKAVWAPKMSSVLSMACMNMFIWL